MATGLSEATTDLPEGQGVRPRAALPGAEVNPVRSRADWEAMRKAALDDPGSFHGDIAARTIHWFVGEIGAAGAWIMRSEDGSWQGWDAATGAAVSPGLPADFAPWDLALDRKSTRLNSSH